MPALFSASSTPCVARIGRPPDSSYARNLVKAGRAWNFPAPAKKTPGPTQIQEFPLRDLLGFVEQVDTLQVAICHALSLNYARL